MGEGLQNLDQCSAPRGTTNARRPGALTRDLRYCIEDLFQYKYAVVFNDKQDVLKTVNGTYHPSKKIVPNTKELCPQILHVIYYIRMNLDVSFLKL